MNEDRSNVQRREVMEDISLIEFWYGIRKRLPLIVLVTLMIVILVSSASVFILQKEYRTRTTLIVGRPASYTNSSQALEYNDVLLSQRLVGSYSEIMKSDTVTKQVNQNLGLNISNRELSEKINVQTVANTEIISLTVTDTIPERAMDIANETATIFMDEVRTIMQVDNVQLLDAATLPEHPVSPNVLMNTAIAGILGLMLGVLIALIKEFTDTRVKSVEDYKNAFDIPVIGIIPLAKGE